MTRRAILWTLSIFAALAVGSCGDPKVEAPVALEVVYMPLDGAVDLERDVPVVIYFSAAVDGSSVSSSSVFLESGAPIATGCEPATELPWASLDWEVAVDADESNLVRIGTDTDLLAWDTCYRITLTTVVKGTSSGPLVDMGSVRSGVADEALFRTRAN